MSNKSSVSRKLVLLAEAYEASRCHGFCPSPGEELQDLAEELTYKVSDEACKKYQGNSTNEIARMIVDQIMKERGVR